MMIIGVDYHPSFQTIAFFMEETGECGEQELKHSDGQAEKFYRDLKQRGICVRVEIEATGLYESAGPEPIAPLPFGVRHRPDFTAIFCSTPSIGNKRSELRQSQPRPGTFPTTNDGAGAIRHA